MSSDRRIAGPWARDLRDGSAARSSPDGEVVASIAKAGHGWVFAVTTRSGIHHAVSREAAKAAADAALAVDGYYLVDVPGGCKVEEPEAKMRPHWRGP